jgi:DNA segregation ATPase FtsK/SpoIIIE, S-DNA-T family
MAKKSQSNNDKSRSRASASKRGTTQPTRGGRSAIRLQADHLYDFAGILLTLAGLVTGLAFLPSDHPTLIQPWIDLLTRVFGLLAVVVPLAMIVTGIGIVARKIIERPGIPVARLLGLMLTIVVLLGFLGFAQQWRDPGLAGAYGGLIGLSIARVLVAAIGEIGAPVALGFLAVLGFLFLFEMSLDDLGRSMGRARMLFARAVETLHRSLHSLSSQVDQVKERWAHFAIASRERQLVPAIPFPVGSPTLQERQADQTELDTTPWQLPPWRDLLDDVNDSASDVDDIRRKTAIIEETLAHFGIPVRVVEVNRGPTVTQYGVEPGFIRRQVRGKEREIKVKVSAITSLQNDLALALAVPRIRIEAPVPGRGYVGIEVPNDRANAVTLYGAMDSEEFRETDGALRVALGRDVTGNAVVADLARMPHLLIAGSTGSGKSVCINAIIANLLCHNTPHQLKLLMVDPKMVELVGYNGIPHLIVPVVTDLERVVGLLRWTVSEMERRYKLFSQSQVRNLAAYNAKVSRQGNKPLPYLVLIIDELADLMMAAADQVEGMICRLAQMARATGIHLILATQRPSVDVVTGLIKANFPSRIAFAVTSLIDSRVILDRPGAETLLGRGDMLYMSSDSSALKRAQGCFVGDRELERINDFWREQAQQATAPADVRPATTRQEEQVEPVQPVLWDDLLEEPGDEEDELLPAAREVVRKAGTASVSMLQRRLRVGYARAARLVDLLEQEGTIGMSEGPGKTREVFRETVHPGSDDDPGYDPSWVDDDQCHQEEG